MAEVTGAEKYLRKAVFYFFDISNFFYKSVNFLGNILFFLEKSKFFNIFFMKLQTSFTYFSVVNLDFCQNSSNFPD